MHYLYTLNSLQRQYVFLYDALLEAYLYGDTAVEAKNVKHHVWSLTQENQAGGTTGMEQEFNVCIRVTS